MSKNHSDQKEMERIVALANTKQWQVTELKTSEQKRVARNLLAHQQYNRLHHLVWVFTFSNNANCTKIV